MPSYSPFLSQPRSAQPAILPAWPCLLFALFSSLALILGATSNALALPPTIASVVPTPVTYGITTTSSITISGSNFVVGATITVGSLSGPTVTGTAATAATPFVYVSTSQLRFYWANTSLPVGSYDVTVTTPGPTGGTATRTNGFTVTAPQPTITSASPASVVYGVSASGQVIVQGTNFVLGATITVGTLSGTTVAGATATAGTPFVYVGSSQLRFYWPNTSLPVGAYDVQVTNPSVAGSLSATRINGFTVTAPQPTIISASPASVAYGVNASGQVIVQGTNFVLGATITVGTLSGTTVAGATATAGTPFVYVGSSQLRFYWPNTSLPVGAYDVQVTNPPVAGSLSATLTNGFTVTTPQPTITSVTPASVVYGVTASQSVTISGTNFTVGATITVGTLTGTTVTGTLATAGTLFVFVNSTTLRFYWANTSLPVGVVDVQVTNPAAGGGLSAILTNGFTVTTPQPTITSVTPASVTYAVTPASSMTIQGTNFVVGATITINSSSTPDSLTGTTVAGSIATAGTPFVFVNSTILRFYWPNSTALAIGTYNVQVTNPTAAGSGSITLPGGFTVITPQPTIANLSPSSVTYAVTPAQSITIQGSNFVVGATITVSSSSTPDSLSGTTVAGGTATAGTPFVFVNSTILRFYWPNSTALAIGTYTVEVTNPSSAGGLSAVPPGSFTVATPTPTIASVTPSTVEFGFTASQAITITGADFAPPDPLRGTDGVATITVGSLSGSMVVGTAATALTPFVYINSQTLQFFWTNTVLPEGVYTVQVTNPNYAGGASSTSTVAFTVTVLHPQVTSVQPNVVTAGLSPSQAITINGSQFATFTDLNTGVVTGPTVSVGSFSGIAVPGFTPTAATPVVFVNGTQLKWFWQTNSVSPGTYNVTVTNPIQRNGQSGTLTNGFRVTGQAEVTGVQPAAIGAGAQRAVVSIQGTGLLAGSLVSFDFQSGTSGTSGITAQTGFVANATANGGTITINVAENAALGLRNVIVTSPNGLPAPCTATACVVTITPGPAIGSITPAIAAGAIGRTLTINGQGFQSGAVVTLPNGITGTCSVTTSTTIGCSNVAVSPDIIPGLLAVVVTNPDRGRGSVQMTINAGPRVQSISPSNGNVGATVSVQISGSGFHAGAVVALGSDVTASVTSVSDTLLTVSLAISNAASAGYHPLTITNSDDGGRIVVNQAFFVGTPPADLIAALATFGGQAVAEAQYQRFQGTTWSNRFNGPSLSAPPVWQVMKANPIRDERLLAVFDEQRALTLHVWNGQGWQSGLQVAALTGLARLTQTVDMAFEQISGKGLVVYGVTGSTALRYRLWDGTSWSAEQLVPALTGLSGAPQWVRLEARPARNEIILGYEDANNAVGALVWNGDQLTWGDAIVLTSNAAGHTAPLFDVAFERKTGRAIVVWATVAAPSTPSYRIWNSGWGTEATAPVASDSALTPLTSLRLVADPTGNSNRIALGASSGTSAMTLAVLLWDGTQWSDPPDQILTTNLAMDGGGRGFDLAWEGISGDLVAVYGTVQKPRGVSRARATAGVWSSETDIPLPVLPGDKVTTLTGPCAISDAQCVIGTSTLMFVDNADDFPQSGVVAIDAELIRYTTKSTNTLSGLTHGVLGTISSDHANGALVTVLSLPAWTELASARGGDGMALGLFDSQSRVRLSRWDGNAWTDAVDAQDTASGYVAGVAGRAIAVSVAQHLAGAGPPIDPPPAPVLDTTPPGTPTFLASTLTTAVSSTDTSMVVSNANAFPPSGTIEVESELISYTSKTVTSLSGLSRGVSGTTPAAHALGASVVATVVTATTANLSWVAVGDDGATGGPVASYQLRKTLNGNTSIVTVPGTQSPGGTEQFTVTSLVGNSAYVFALVAVDDAGNTSSGSTSVTVRTLADQAPGAITDLQSTAQTENSITLQWTRPTDDSGPLAGYVVKYTTSGAIQTDPLFGAATTYSQQPQTIGSSVTLVVQGLLPGTTYYFAVKAVDAVSQLGGLSNSAQATTTVLAGDTTAPTPISDLSVFASATTGISVLLKWTATGDDGLNGTAGAYDLRYATAPLTGVNFAQGTPVATFAPGAAGSQQELVVSGLTSNTIYYFAMKVIDDGGNVSAISNVATGHTALRRGYTIVSIPRDLSGLSASDSSAEAVVGDDVGLPVYAYRWQSSGPLTTDGCYEGTASFAGFTPCNVLGSIRTSKAYFLYSFGALAVLDAPGSPVTSPTYETPLDLGSNMIGNPYDLEVNMANVQVRLGVGTPVSYANAVAQAWVGSALVVYDGASYQALTIGGPTPVVLKPWNGGFIEALVPGVTLIIPQP